MPIVCLRVLLAVACLPLLIVAVSPDQDTSIAADDENAKSNTSCGDDCENEKRARKRRGDDDDDGKDWTCEMYYFVPTEKDDQQSFQIWNWRHVAGDYWSAIRYFRPFLLENSHAKAPVYFPAHVPVSERGAIALRDIYVRAFGRCDQRSSRKVLPPWLTDEERRTEVEAEMLEHYLQHMPRSHWGSRAPSPGETNVCLDESGLVVQDFPGIGTCFSMWLMEGAGEPEYYSGRQMYNRIDQSAVVDVTQLREMKRALGDDDVRLPGLFTGALCYITNRTQFAWKDNVNVCHRWSTNRFFITLCCCYQNRIDCAFKRYLYPLEKEFAPHTVTCATGTYPLLAAFGGALLPQKVEGSVGDFVRAQTSTVCAWETSWDYATTKPNDYIINVTLSTVPEEEVDELRWFTGNATKRCYLKPTPCPVETPTGIVDVQCYCRKSDLCNKRESYLDMDLATNYTKGRPCFFNFTVYEHLLSEVPWYTRGDHRYMCPLHYDLVTDDVVHLVDENNFVFVNASDLSIYLDGGCHLVELDVYEGQHCAQRMKHSRGQKSSQLRLVLLCSEEGNLDPDDSNRPDKRIYQDLQAGRVLPEAKAEFPTCKNGSVALNFMQESALVVNHTKLTALYDTLNDTRNDDITTVHCFMKVELVYQQQYNFTFGDASVSFYDTALHDLCAYHDGQCLAVPSAPNASLSRVERFICCCRRHWSGAKDMCRGPMIGLLGDLLNDYTIAREPNEIVAELAKDPPGKCTRDEHGRINRACARNLGCYQEAHVRIVDPISHTREAEGCASEYAPDMRMQQSHSTHAEDRARYYRICRLPQNRGKCVAQLGTTDSQLPDGVQGPKVVCCCDEVPRFERACRKDVFAKLGETLEEFQKRN